MQVTDVLDVQEFLASLKRSQLLSANDYSRAASAAAEAGMDGTSLSDWLVSNGLLTDYQVDVIANGEFAKLRIGNYEVLDRLGAGGMGTVFKARHARMKRIVALKVLSQTLTKDES